MEAIVTRFVVFTINERDNGHPILDKNLLIAQQHDGSFIAGERFDQVVAHSMHDDCHIKKLGGH